MIGVDTVLLTHVPWDRPGMKQWLMIGDSISDGVLGVLHDAGTNVTSHGIQVSHNPTNAANVWWGTYVLVQP